VKKTFIFVLDKRDGQVKNVFKDILL